MSGTSGTEAHRVTLEVEKLGEARGGYLHPELFGQTSEMRVPSMVAEAAGSVAPSSNEEGDVR